MKKEQKFKLKSDFAPSGDQPEAIKKLTEGIKKGLKHQTLLGVTGSGKTFTIANVIEKIQKPTLIIAHNKTLAAQLAQEYKEFFPENAVHYFVSYYDYYQPEAYVPVSDTYIEKEAMINEEIERLRHASTQALLTRKDVIIVASVSCIYGLGSPIEYERVNLKIEKGQKVGRGELTRKLIEIHFERTPSDLSPGQFRAIGNVVEIMPVSEKFVYRLEIENDKILNIQKIDAVTRAIIEETEVFFLFPAKHFISSKEQNERAFKSIKTELNQRLKELEKQGKLLEAERLKRRTNYDLALIREMGYCNGIENYSRHFDGRKPGEPPYTLLSYFDGIESLEKYSLEQPGYFSAEKSPHSPARSPRVALENIFPDFLTIIDESHVTVPQIGAMYAGDASRKQSLVDFGFRLPSCKDNRPLTFKEFEQRIGQVIYTSATPSDYEREHSSPSREGQIVEQIIRPTGLTDPIVEVRPITERKEDSSKKHSLINREKKLSRKASLPKVLGSPVARPSQTFVENFSGQQAYPGQIADFINEAEKHIKNGGRVIATTLTKKMAEDLSEYLKDRKIKAEYLHSEIKTIERIEILTKFRKGEFDVLVGVNLLREGLDLPEVTLIGILDADKEGFLRSQTSLIQIIGRAARNVLGKVILYADNITASMQKAIEETERRRAIQVAYNKKHGITPKTIIKKIRDITEEMKSEHQKAVSEILKIDTNKLNPSTSSGRMNLKKLIHSKEKQMEGVVKILDFETAALLRDEILELTKLANPKPEKKSKNPKNAKDALR